MQARESGKSHNSMEKYEIYKKRNKDIGNGINLNIRFSVCSDSPQYLDAQPNLGMHYLRRCPPDWATGSEIWQLSTFTFVFLVHTLFWSQISCPLIFGLFLDWMTQKNMIMQNFIFGISWNIYFDFNIFAGTYILTYDWVLFSFTSARPFSDPFFAPFWGKLIRYVDIWWCLE